MPSRKRPPFGFPEFEPKGSRAVLRSVEEVQADEQLLAQQEETTALREPGSAERRISAHAERRTGERAAVPKSVVRSTYHKTGYRIRPDAVDAIEDMRRILRRDYQIKALLEEICEEAILAVYRDLVEHKEESQLVRALSEPEDTR